MVTRKLRRRHYDPLPMPEKRRKLAPLSSLVYVLDEHEVDDDLKVIFKVSRTDSQSVSQSVVYAAKCSCIIMFDCGVSAIFFLFAGKSDDQFQVAYLPRYAACIALYIL